MNERRRGQALVEFALVLPVFMALLLGIVDVGRVVWAQNALASGAREAARFAVVHGGSASDPCPVGPAGPDASIPPVSADCPHPSPSKDAIREAARTAALAAGSDVTVFVCYGAGCTGDTDAPGATNVRGTPITVAITSRVWLVVPSLLGVSFIPLSGTSTMLVNH